MPCFLGCNPQYPQPTLTNSFVVKTIIDWNKLNESHFQVETMTDFSHLTCGSRTQ